MQKGQEQGMRAGWALGQVPGVRQSGRTWGLTGRLYLASPVAFL